MGLKTLRDRFEESYTAVQVPANNAKGFKIKYVYYAPWYIWDLPQRKLKKEKLLLFSCSIISLIFFFVAATGITQSNYSAPVYIPAILAFCAHIFELAALFQFAAAKYKVTKMTYGEIDRIMRLAPMVRAACCSISGLVSVAYICLNGFSRPSSAVAAGYIACAGIAGFMYGHYCKIPYRIEDNNASVY